MLPVTFAPVNDSRFDLDTIIDDLANQGYAVVDSFLNAHEVDSFLELDEFRDGLLHLKKAGIGQKTDFRVNEAIRGDYIRWIDPETANGVVKTYLDRVHELMAYVNRTLFLSLKDIELHMTVYPAGAYYKRHLDQFKPGDHRKLSIITYLNKDWSEDLGGQLRMYTETGSVDFLPLAGRMVCFRSDLLEHEVLPSKKERLSVTGWMLDQPVGLKHLG